jgi:hypothetical protein
MIRHAAAVVIVMILNPVWLHAQTVESPELTVRVQSATIHRGPSTASPAIGRAPRGTVLVVTRDLGSWFRVEWPDAEDGVGYVHQRMGSLTNRAPREQRLAAAIPPSPAAPRGASPAMSPAGSTSAAVEPAQLTGTTYIAAPTHFVGFGGRIGGSPSRDFGATARVWSRGRFGVQLEASRSALPSDLAPGRVTSVQFAPAAIYSIRDHVTDNFWLRPYAGGGATLRRSTFKFGPADADGITDSGLAYRAFGGAEVTFPAVPRFAISADAGYVWSDTPFPGFELGGFGFSLSGHWYVK